MGQFLDTRTLEHRKERRGDKVGCTPACLLCELGSSAPGQLSDAASIDTAQGRRKAVGKKKFQHEPPWNRWYPLRCTPFPAEVTLGCPETKRPKSIREGFAYARGIQWRSHSSPSSGSKFSIWGGSICGCAQGGQGVGSVTTLRVVDNITPNATIRAATTDMCTRCSRSL